MSTASTAVADASFDTDTVESPVSVPSVHEVTLAEYPEPPGTESVEVAELKPFHRDPEVESLPAGADAAMEALVPRLRSADAQVAAHLYEMALDPSANADARSLAVEIFAAARVPTFEPFVVHVILRLLDSPEEGVRFAAVAAASDVSTARRVAFGPAMGRLSSEREPSEEVRQAARAFLRADGAARR